jgi:hypothetical protein
MIESVDVGRHGELFKHCWFSKMVPRMLLLLSASSNLGTSRVSAATSVTGSSLAFYLRTIKSLVSEYPRTDNVFVKNGLVESIALCLVAFTDTAEVWMIDNDTVLFKSIVDVFLSFTSEILRSEKSDGRRGAASLMGLNALLSFIGTPRSTHALSVDIVKSALAAKPIPSGEGDISQLVSELRNLVDNDILYRELGI